MHTKGTFSRAANAAEESSADRPTLVPTFDVPQLAKDSDRWTRDSGVRPAVRADASALDGSVHVRAADVYWSRLGGRRAVPILLLPLEQVPPEQRARCEGFLLCRVDGKTTLADIIESSGLPELTALCLACDLFDACVIALTEPELAEPWPTKSGG